MDILKEFCVCVSCLFTFYRVRKKYVVLSKKTIAKWYNFGPHQNRFLSDYQTPKQSSSEGTSTFQTLHFSKSK